MTITIGLRLHFPTEKQREEQVPPQRRTVRVQLSPMKDCSLQGIRPSAHLPDTTKLRGSQVLTVNCYICPITVLHHLRFTDDASTSDEQAN